MVERREELKYVEGKHASGFAFSPTRTYNVGESNSGICGQFKFQTT